MPPSFLMKYISKIKNSRKNYYINCPIIIRPQKGHSVEKHKRKREARLLTKRKKIHSSPFVKTTNLPNDVVHLQSPFVCEITSKSFNFRELEQGDIFSTAHHDH